MNRSDGARVLALLFACGALLAAAAPSGAAASAGMAFGFNEDPVDRDAPRIAQLQAAAGAEVQRFVVSWAAVQPRRGAPPDFSAYRRYADALAAEGIRPLPVLMSAPRWAWQLGESLCLFNCRVPPGRQHLGAWRDFAAATAAQFPDAVAFEIWNEPNWPGFWTTLLGPDPRRYGELYLWARRGIASVNPGAPVLVGGLGTVPRDLLLGPKTIRTFLGALYDSGALAEMQPSDAIAVHTYPTTDHALDETLSQTRQVIAAHDPGRRMWLTETGISNTGLNAVSRTAQADALARAYDRLLGEPDVDAMIIHRLRDEPSALGLGAEAGYGVLDSALQPKPAYCTIAGIRGMPPPSGC